MVEAQQSKQQVRQKTKTQRSFNVSKRCHAKHTEDTDCARDVSSPAPIAKHTEETEHGSDGGARGARGAMLRNKPRHNWTVECRKPQS